MTSVAYVLKRYPRISETFILQEILGLERLGVRLHLFAIMDPREPIVHPAVRQVQADVEYLSSGTWADFARSVRCHGQLFFLSPGRYARALSHVLRTRRRTRAGLYLALKHFMQAGVLATRLQAKSVDHVHAHFAHNPTTLARFAQLFTDIPFSFTTHAKDLYLADPARLADKIHYSHFVVTCTACNRNYIHRLLRSWRPQWAADDIRKVHLLYHGVDLNRFRPGTGHPEDATASPTILSVGRLVEKKRFADLILACQLLKSRGHRFRCDIFGSGPLKGTLSELIQRLAVEDVVRLRGTCTQDEIVPIYQAANIFALAPAILDSGDRDGIPNVLLEAMACGLAVVATNVSGIPELIESGQNGLLVPPRTPDRLADAIERLLLDVGLRQRLGQAARQHVTWHFDAKVAPAHLATLFGYGSIEPGDARAGNLIAEQPGRAEAFPLGNR